MASIPADFVSALGTEFPPDFLTREPGDLAEYGKDWTKVTPPAPSAIALPRTTDEVSRLVALANRHRVAIVPSGGRTGLAGGALAAKGEVVVSMVRMRRMDAVDLLGSTVRVQAGAVTEEVHKHCAPHGLTWPVDFASKGSSHVGGNIATNAGGVKVIRYGLTRNWVLGLQVVLASGEVLELGGGLEKNNTGIDLRQLFIGSEGILGIVTEATLKLTRHPRTADVVLLAIPSFAAVLEVFERAQNASFTLMAFESFTDRCLAHVIRRHQLQPAFEVASNHYALLEVSRGEDSIDGW